MLAKFFEKKILLVKWKKVENISMETDSKHQRGPTVSMPDLN